MRIQKMLNKPHPFVFNQYSVLLPSLITFLVLIILKPFEFDTFSTTELIIWGAIFAALVGLTVFLSVLVVKQCFYEVIKRNWTVRNEVFLILFVLAMISVVMYVLFLYLNPQANRNELFRLVVLRTLVISFFPVLILVLYEQNYHQRVKRQQAERLNQELQKRQSSSPIKDINATFPKKIMLVAENQKAALHIDPLDLYFVKSEGNYVEVFYQQNQKVQKELIRNSLKTIEEQLPAADFFRCHNRFLINLHHIQKVEGNARNFELVLENIEEKIPVSRSKSETLIQYFQQKV